MSDQSDSAHFPLQWFTLSPQRRAQSDARSVSFLIRTRVDLIVRIVLVVVVVALLSTPMVVLPHTRNSTTLTFLVVTLYTIVFSICLSATTRARRQDHFAICAAVSLSQSCRNQMLIRSLPVFSSPFDFPKCIWTCRVLMQATMVLRLQLRSPRVMSWSFPFKTPGSGHSDTDPRLWI